jgi:hypothetical protein
MDYPPLTPDTTFPYRLFRFAHKRTLDSVSSSYFAIVSKDNNAVGLVLSIDIDEQWHHARSAATTFWQIFVREFNHSESRSTLTRFEEGLKELNKAVVKTQEKVHQPISVAAAIFENNQIHFSTIGTNRVLLSRDGKFSDVTSGSDKSGNQFAAVTSGDLTDSDAVMICNQNFYEFIAAEPDELWRHADATALAEEFLARAQNTAEALNCVLIQYDADNPAQTTLYWEDSEKRYPISLPKVRLPKLALPAVALPKWPKKFQLKSPRSINFSKIVEPFKSLKIKKVHLIIAGLVILAIVSTSLLSGRANQESPAPQQSLSDKFAGLGKDEFISQALAELSGNSQNLSPSDLTEITQIAAAYGIEIIANPTPTSQLPATAVAADSAGNSLYIVDETGQLWQLGSTNQLKQIDHQFKVINPTALVAFKEDSVIISDNLGNIWFYQGKTAGPTAIALPSKLSSGEKLISKFANNLYLYSRQQNAVYRQANFSGTISTSTPYFGLTALGNTRPISWSINGDFLMVTNDKKIIGILREKITLQAIASPYATATSRISATDQKIAVADGNLLTIYDSSGQLLKQSILISKDPISAIAATTEGLWLTVGKDIIKLSY